MEIHLEVPVDARQWFAAVLPGVLACLVAGAPETAVIKLTGSSQIFEPGGPSNGITIRDLTFDRVSESLDNWEAI